MAVQTPTPVSNASADIFISYIVDSAVPAWDEVFQKWCMRMVKLILRVYTEGHVPNVSPKLRFSYVLYSSAEGNRSPILKDVYFVPHSDSMQFYQSIASPLNTPIARCSPGGGSAALEAFVRVVEHHDLLEKLEPLASTSHQKYIIWATASPPDGSEVPLWNMDDRFDKFGWNQCGEWLKERSIELSIIFTRQPIHSTYTNLYKTMHPGAKIEAIPNTGSVRVLPSEKLATLAKQPLPNAVPNPPIAGKAHTPAPAPSQPPTASTPQISGQATGTPSAVQSMSSPAPGSSPSAGKKRKPTEDLQVSPRRPKPPPISAGSAPLPAVPPVPAVINPPPRPVSVGIKQEPGIKQENMPPPLTMANLNTAPGGSRTQIPSVQANAFLMGASVNPPQQPAPVNPQGHPMQTNTALVPIANLDVAYANFNTPVAFERFRSATLESQKQTIQKLLTLRDEQEKYARQLFQEGKLEESQQRFEQRNKWNDVVMRMTRVVQEQIQSQQARLGQGQGQGSQLPAGGLGTGQTMGPNSGQLGAQGQVAQSGGQIATQPSERALQLAATVTDLTRLGASPYSNNPAMNTMPSGGSTNTGGVNIPSTSGVNIPGNGGQQGGTSVPGSRIAWRGALRIAQGGKIISAEVSIALNALKIDQSTANSMPQWPSKLLLHIAKIGTSTAELPKWLQENGMVALFSVIPGVDPVVAMNNPLSVQGQLEGFKKFQDAVVNQKFTLAGAIPRPTGEQQFIFVFALQASTSIGAPLAAAIFNRQPNLNSLPVAASIGQNSSQSTSNAGPSNTADRSINVGLTQGLNVGSNTNPMQLSSGNVPAAATSNIGGLNIPSHLANNPNLAQYAQGNSALLAQLQRMRQQQGTGGAIAGAANLGLNNAALGNTGLSGANLLDRLGTNALHTGAGGGGNMMGAGRGQMDQQTQQRLLASFSAQGGMGAMGASNNPYASLGGGTQGLRENNPNSNNLFTNQGNNPGLGLGINMGNLGLSNAGADLNMMGRLNANAGGMNQSGGLGQGGGLGQLGAGGRAGQQDMATLTQAASTIARQSGISIQDAMRFILQRGGLGGGAGRGQG